jgi:hypothetical protein
VSDQAEAEGSVTAILKRADPVWWWLRENFKLPSVAAIVSVVAGSVLWIYNQRADLHALQAQQKTLATSDQVAAVQSALEAIRTQLNDHGDRLDRLERNWDDAGRVAAETRIRTGRSTRAPR